MKIAGLTLHCYQIDIKLLPGEIKHQNSEGSLITVASFIPREQFLAAPDINTIIGVIRPGYREITRESLYPNPHFKKWIFHLAGERSKDLKWRAQRQQEGAIAVLDYRGQSIEHLSPCCDIIGLHLLERGKVVEFLPNEEYALISDNGFACFTPGIIKQIKKSIENHP